jgi:hypothetical protein
MSRHLLRYSEIVLEGVRETMSPPRSATSREIRVNGALCVLAAVLVLGFSCILLFSAQAASSFKVRQFPIVLLIPSLLFYVLTIVGGYRVLVGKSPEPAYPGEVSLKRVAYGIASTLLVCALIFGLLAIGAYFFP